MYIASKWRGQATNDFWFDGLFFKTDTGLIFSDTFDGLIDVSVLTGDELGCVPNPGDLKAWDMITTVSEQARSVGGRYIDGLINVGCINPTKVKGTRLSLYSVNFEVAPDTFGPTIKSTQESAHEEQRRGVREARAVAVEGPRQDQAPTMPASSRTRSRLAAWRPCPSPCASSSTSLWRLPTTKIKPLRHTRRSTR